MNTINRIGIYVNSTRDRGFLITERLLDFLRQQSVLGLFDEASYSAEDVSLLRQKLGDRYRSGDYATCQLLVSLGGDGTFLSAAHLPAASKLSLVGINLGSVGFLPQIMPNQLEASMEKILAGDISYESRMLLNVTIYDQAGQIKESTYALNDAVLSRGAEERILTMDLIIDGIEIEKIPADGLIVASPTGSTAYTLSAGGPITHPELDLQLITPICPHTLHNRTWLAKPDSIVCLQIEDYPAAAQIAIDGRVFHKLLPGERVEITRADRNLTMVRLSGDNFFQTLPQKIQRRGSVG